MADVVDAGTRSRMMSGIRGKDTKPELIIRSALHCLGFRFRIHDRRMPGKPDLVLRKYRAVIFVHGCFWHRHDCELFKWPQSRSEFWAKKLNGNHENDRAVVEAISASGWRVCVVWECALKGRQKDKSSVVNTIAVWLAGDEAFLEVSG